MALSASGANPTLPIAAWIMPFLSVRYRTDKNGIIHAAIGKVGFAPDALKANLDALLGDLKKAKPASAKGVYFKKVSVSTTMGPGVQVDQSGLNV